MTFSNGCLMDLPQSLEKAHQMGDEEIGRLLIKSGTNAMTLFRFTMLWTLQCIKVAVSIAVLTGLLTACATMTTFSPDIADQSGLSGQMTPDEAVAIIRTKASASGVDADHGSFMIDGKGLSFAKTDTVKKKIKFKGEIVEIEFDETRIQQVAWQSISKLEPYLKNTIVGDLYGVRLELLASSPKTIGILSGILAVGIFAWKFKETPLCRP